MTSRIKSRYRQTHPNGAYQPAAGRSSAVFSAAGHPLWIPNPPPERSIYDHRSVSPPSPPIPLNAPSAFAATHLRNHPSLGSPALPRIRKLKDDEKESTTGPSIDFDEKMTLEAAAATAGARRVRMVGPGGIVLNSGGGTVGPRATRDLRVADGSSYARRFILEDRKIDAIARNIHRTGNTIEKSYCSRYVSGAMMK